MSELLKLKQDLDAANLEYRTGPEDCIIEAYGRDANGIDLVRWAILYVPGKYAVIEQSARGRLTDLLDEDIWEIYRRASDEDTTDASDLDPIYLDESFWPPTEGSAHRMLNKFKHPDNFEDVPESQAGQAGYWKGRYETLRHRLATYLGRLGEGDT